MSSLIVEVCRVDSIIKHPNADRLSIATIKGWSCIVGLDQYKVGDLVVYCPPDSIIPQNLIEKYELTYLKNGGRVGTTKLRGYLSQGLILDLPEGRWKVGDDVAEVLGITKWSPPEPKYYSQAVKHTSKKKLNPLFDKYTDIENIKHYNDVFCPGDLVVVTEKIHGTNARFSNLEIVIDKNQPFLYRLKKWFEKKILRHTHEFVYGSHNVQISGNDNRHSFYGDDVWGKIAKKYKLGEVIAKDYIVYGEIYGPGIQDLTYGLKEIDLVVFDVKYKGQYLSWNEFRNFCIYYDLPTVPVLYVGNYYDGLLETHTNGRSNLCSTQIREGCVIKSVDEINHPRIGRKILKSVSPDYLLRKDGTEFK